MVIWSEYIITAADALLHLSRLGGGCCSGCGRRRGQLCRFRRRQQSALEQSELSVWRQLLQLGPVRHRQLEQSLLFEPPLCGLVRVPSSGPLPQRLVLPVTIVDEFTQLCGLFLPESAATTAAAATTTAHGVSGMHYLPNAFTPANPTHPFSPRLYGSSAVPSVSSSQAGSQQTAANSVSSSSAQVRFTHHYPSAYPGSMSAFDPSVQSRLSPYQSTGPQVVSAGGPGSVSSSGGGAGGLNQSTPNSPQYRSSGGYPPPPGGSSASQLPVLSPRRPTATPPAGSPMPPTSHTPGPPSVGSVNSAQGSSQSAFSIATPGGGGGHLANSSSSSG